MSTKALKLNSFEFKPQLVDHYIDAHRRILGVQVRVKAADYSKFRVLESDLRELGYAPQEYADTVIAVLKDWLKYRKLKIIPVNVFYGKFAFDKFQKVRKSKNVRIIANNDNHIELLQSELTVARTYVEWSMNKEFAFMHIVSRLRVMLSPAWLELYYNGGRHELIAEALEIMCPEYGLSQLTSYKAIIWELKHERHLPVQ